MANTTEAHGRWGWSGLRLNRVITVLNKGWQEVIEYQKETMPRDTKKNPRLFRVPCKGQIEDWMMTYVVITVSMKKSNVNRLNIAMWGSSWCSISKNPISNSKKLSVTRTNDLHQWGVVRPGRMRNVTVGTITMKASQIRGIRIHDAIGCRIQCISTELTILSSWEMGQHPPNKIEREPPGKETKTEILEDHRRGLRGVM